ncbi:MAG: phosphate--acyl-ACP acyltransferase, partial [Candidatus Margulisbacteria bacterium]|nr:phosphate--acyl-ACP acyltransferase [Candidatus Margulisiibacteriota bacterium]
ESIASFIMSILKVEISKSFTAKIGAVFLLPSLKRLKKKINYDEYGGAQLLGINGVCVKAHGRSKARAIMNAIRVAEESVKENLVDCIKKVETK